MLQNFRLFFRYLSRPTYIETEIVEQLKANFPALTLCAVNSTGNYSGGYST